ncbi:MAG: hypothetical protein KAW03_09275 [Candidatus Lokiarchaeota archaeon]|nr:hypothetical protein [Candidatus Lokiarchaeota archaeon]
MDFLDNLRKLSKNWRLTALVIWLLIGVAIIPYPNPVVSVIGIIIFFPFLVYLMFLFLLSLVSKKNIFEYPPWKVIVFLLISLPIMALISIILILLFVISVITYFLFTSWFILYGCFLMGKRVDRQAFKTPKAKPFIRTLIFIGGLAGSLALLYLFIILPTLVDLSVITETPIIFPWYLNGVYIVVGAILVVLAIVIIVYKFKKVFNGWFGIFTLLATFYTLFLVIKIYLGLVDSKSVGFGPIWAYLSMIIPDMLIIFYSLSTLMGSQAELLSKRLKRFGLDTVIIWLILSKVTYEFVHYFPYEIFNIVPIPWIRWFAIVDNDLVNLIKNIAVLGFFVLLLIIIGIYEIRKYAKEVLKPIEEPEAEVMELTSPQPTLEQPEPIMEEPEPMKEETEKFEEDETSFYEEEDNDNEFDDETV